MTGDFRYAYDASLGVPATRIVPVHGNRGVEAPPTHRMRLGEALVESGVLTPDQVEHCLRAQQGGDPRKRLGTVAIERGFCTDVDIAHGLARILGFDCVDPSAMDVPVDVARRIPRATAELFGVVPIGAGDTWLRVATADPTDRVAIDGLRDVTGLPTIALAVSTLDMIDRAVERFWADSYRPLAPAPEPILTLVPDPPDEPELVAPAGPGWEYTMVGDGLPVAHPNACVDLAETERRLAELGAQGWEAYGVHANSNRMRVLLKRRTGAV